MSELFNDTFWLAQIFGVCALFLSIVAWQIKSSKNVILCYIPICAFYMIQDFLLGAYVGAIISLLNIFKNSVLYKYEKQFAKYVIYIFIIIVTILSIPFINSIIDILPLFAVYISSLSFLNPLNRNVIARGNLVCQLFYITYSLQYGAYVGVAASVVVTISNILGMIRHENWQIGKCYRSFVPNITRSLLNFSFKI